MSSTQLADPSGGQTINHGSLRANKLGVTRIVFFVVASAAPLGAFVGGSPVLYAFAGSATPLVYILAGLVMAVFAVGYLKMSRHTLNASGFVSYISKGLGNRAGGAAAGLAVVTYTALQIGFFGLFGVFARGLFAEHLGLDLPELVWILLALVFVTVLTASGVDASFMVLGILIAAELAVLVVLLAGFLSQHGLSVFDVGGFSAEALFVPGIGIALLFAIATFTTVEATVVFSEEAREPRKTIPRALYIVIVFVGLVYFVATWATQGVVGVDQIQQVAIENPDTFIFGLAVENVGAWLAVSIQVLLVTSFVAMLLGLFNMFSRYLFGLGRSGFLPSALQKVSQRGTPTTAVVANSIVVGVLLTVFLLAGADPWGIVYLWGTAIGTAGFVLILLFTSIAVVIYFLRNRDEEGLWSTRVAPATATVVLAFVAYLAFANFDLLSGGSPVARWLLIALPLALGIGWQRSRAKRSIDFTTASL